MIDTAIVVEDCKLTLQMTKFILTKLGVKKIFTASNAREFQNLIDVSPDLIITDWNIENDFKGRDVIKAFEKLGKPIAIVSSEDGTEMFHKKCHWFKKPLKLKELESWLREIYY